MNTPQTHNIPAQILLLSAKLQPTEEELTQLNQLILEVEDWSGAVEYLIDRQAGPLLFKKLDKLSNSKQIPAEAREALRQSHLHTLGRSMMISAQFQQIAPLFHQGNIPVIAMKGIYLSEWLYRDVGLRQFTDIDLLVKPEDAARVITSLKQIGFRAVEELLPQEISNTLHQVHLPPMVRHGIPVEVHVRLHDVNTAYRVDIPALWQEAEEITLHGVPVQVFGLEHQLLTLVLHLDKHYRRADYKYNSLYDIANLLDLHADKLDIEHLLATADKWNLRAMFQSYLVLIAQYFGLTLPAALHYDTPDEKLVILFKESLSGMPTDGGQIYAEKLSSEGAIKSVRMYDTPIKKFVYIVKMTFPPAAYLKQHYRFTSNWQLPRYYLKRIGDNIGHLRRAGFGALVKAFKGGEKR